MARLPKAAIAVTLLAFVLALLVPAVAVAADAAPWVGTYKGVAVGKDAKGKKGTSGVTVWVEDLGGSSRFTFRFDKFPVVVSRTTPNGGGLRGSQLMRISVNEQGVSGSGLIVVYPRNGNYLMAGKGAGKALGKQGTGRMGAVRTSTGVELPSIADQFSDLFGALLGRKVASSAGKSDAGPGPGGASQALAAVEQGPARVAASGDEAAGDALAAEDDPGLVVEQAPEVVFVKAVAVEPASLIDAAEAKPPVTTQTAFTVTVLLLVLTVAAAVVGVGPKTRRAATAAAAAGAPAAPPAPVAAAPPAPAPAAPPAPAAAPAAPPAAPGEGS
jgi:hypothetical protein